ncbi:MAG: type II toxin-antitoxin system PemK/MazF family toxin, partial [Streptomyces sp.]
MSDARDDADRSAGLPGSSGYATTVEVEPARVGRVRTAYAPDPDGDPDPGE